jgi:hypothetical protein
MKANPTKHMVLANFENALRLAGRMSEETGKNHAVVKTQSPNRPYKVVQKDNIADAVVQFVS